MFTKRDILHMTNQEVLEKLNMKEGIAIENKRLRKIRDKLVKDNSELAFENSNLKDEIKQLKDDMKKIYDLAMTKERYKKILNILYGNKVSRETFSSNEPIVFTKPNLPKIKMEDFHKLEKHHIDHLIHMGGFIIE